MLGFSYEKPIQEVIGMIKNGVLDKDIKEYIIELSEMNELRRDVKEYFDLTCLSNKENEVYTTVGACVTEKEYEAMSKDEKLLHNELQLRVLMVYNDIKAEDK